MERELSVAVLGDTKLFEKNINLVYVKLLRDTET